MGILNTSNFTEKLHKLFLSKTNNKTNNKKRTWLLKKGRNVFFLLTFLPKVAQFVYHRILEILGLEKRIFTATLPLNKIFNFLSQPYQYQQLHCDWLVYNVDLYLLPSIMYGESYKTKVVIRENHSCFVHKSLIGSNNRNTFVMS